MLIFIVFLFLFILLLLLFILFLRLYITLDWNIDSEDTNVFISLSVLHFSIKKKKINLSDISTLQHNETISLNDYWTSFKKIFPKIRVEGITFDLIVGTEDPVYTAFLYPFLQIIETINDQKYRISVDFERELFKSVGQCMISIRLCHTRKVISILKQLQGKGD